MDGDGSNDLHGTTRRVCGRGCGGFTLIELMIAVTIAGVLVGAGLPSFMHTLKNNRVRSAATDLHLSFLMARSESLKRGSNVLLNRSSSDWAGGWTVTATGVTDPLRVNDAFTSVQVDCATSPTATPSACPATVTFNRAGRPTSYIEFRNYMTDDENIQARCVSMSLSGRPRVTVDTDGNPDNGCG